MSFDSGFGGAPPPGHSSITRRSFIAGASAMGIGLAAYAASHGRHQLETTERTFAIKDLPDAFVGFRIVQISDLHLEEYTEAWYLQQVIDRVNALDADLVLITGDYVSHGPRSYEYAWKCAGPCAEILSGLKVAQRFGVIGNHDHIVGREHVIPPLQAHGTPILLDSYVPIERGSDRIWLCGTDDATINPPLLNTYPPVHPSEPVIMMCHEPDYVDSMIADPRFANVDLVLSGHSHGGQVRLPFLGPLILPPLGKKYYDGHYRFGPTQLYVNRGIGTVGMPFRLHCPSEITHITLARA